MILISIKKLVYERYCIVIALLDKANNKYSYYNEYIQTYNEGGIVYA